MKRSLAILSLLLVTAGCAKVPVNQLPAASTYTYHVGAGDTLKIVVYRETALSGDYVVSGRGKVSLPLIGDIAVAGATLDEARQRVVQALSREYVNPNVTVDTVKFRPVFILGEVTQPGEYEYHERMTVMALVAKAGGFGFRANKKVAYVRHDDDDTEEAYALSSGAVVQPGDVVRIGTTIL